MRLKLCSCAFLYFPATRARMVKLDFEAALAAVRSGKSARAASREQKLDVSALRVHARLNPERQRRFEEAERAGLDAMADEMVDVANVWGERFEAAQDSGVPGAAAAVVQLAKLEVDARKWVFAKRHPERYGDKLAVVHGGGVAVGVGLLAGDGDVRDALRQVFELGGAGRALDGGQADTVDAAEAEELAKESNPARQSRGEGVEPSALEENA